ncbi:leucine-zipper of insertion element IS481 domain protein [Bordetella pertussis STO1-CHOC-0019]|nr:leucine-zipper of insertion element IS481 domain protein [Bordetella pertussis STO1-CHOC-0019]
MNTHKHARLTFLRRLEMVQQLIAHQVCVPEAARAYGVADCAQMAGPLPGSGPGGRRSRPERLRRPRRWLSWSCAASG